MQADAIAPWPELPAGGGSDVSRSSPLAQEAPERCSAAVAEQRSLSTGEHGSQPASVLIDPGVPDRERFAMKSVEPAALQPPVHHHRPNP